MSLNYKKSGVDIDAGNDLVNRIKPFAKATARIGANADLGGFGALFDLKQCNYKDPVLVSATDGVGTKLKIAIETNYHKTIGIDLVAMSVNDLLVQGAEPLFFLDYFACSKLNIDVAAEVIESISQGCKQANCALIGGETAEMPDMYNKNDYDLAGFAVGVVEREQIMPKNTSDNDILVAIASSGFHSNGFSLIRYILKENNIKFDDKFLDVPLYQHLLTPTKIYIKSCLPLVKSNKIKALAHITGGGITENLPRVLGRNQQFTIDKKSWQMPEIFKYLQKLGNVEEYEMFRTFNCGVGMIAVIDKKFVEEVLSSLTIAGEKAWIIGQLK